MILMGKFTRLRPVNSLKHIVDVQGGLVAAAQTNTIVISAVDTPSTGVANNIHQGATVGSIFLNVQVAATGTAALANVYMIVMKSAGNALPIPVANVVGVSDERRHVLHQEMIMTEKNTTAIPRTLFKGVIKIPPRIRRFGIDDVLVIGLFAPGVNFDFCIQVIYKEFF